MLLGDAYHITSPAEDGEGAARAMMLAMKEAGISPSEVQYIMHMAQARIITIFLRLRAIKKAFGTDAYSLNINSTKSMTGHMLGAAGAAEFIVCVKTIEEGYNSCDSRASGN